jgi:hypothetical protein
VLFDGVGAGWYTATLKVGARKRANFTDCISR